MSESTIYEVLHEDHRAVSRMLQQAEGAADDGEREDLLAQIGDALGAHSEAEAHTFYAALRQHPELRPQIDEAEREHEEITQLLDHLDHVADESEVAQGIRRLAQRVEHHVQEEENRIFPSARTVLSDDQSRELAKRFEAERAQRVGDGVAREGGV